MNPTGYRDSISYIDDTSTLHEKITEKHILQMKERFDASPSKKIEKFAFRRALYDIAQIILTDKEYEVLFLKIDLERTQTDVSWDEFLTHLMLGFQYQEVDKFSNQLELPIKTHPRVFKSHHRLPITKVTFVPEMQDQRRTNDLYGNYITCTRDGMVNYWSIDMEYVRTVYAKSNNIKIQQGWVLDLVPIPDCRIICVATTDRDLRFYDTTAKKMELRLVVEKLDYMVCALHYCFYEDEKKDNKLLFGDTDGKVYYMKIVAKEKGPFKSNPRDPHQVVAWENVVAKRVKGMSVLQLPTDHTDWVRQVLYYEDIHCVISISMCSEQSMLVYNTKAKKSIYSFQVPKGFSCVAIATNMHLVATGGPDCMVRLWNPFIPERQLSLYRGHRSLIVAIVIQDDNRVMCSIDKERIVRVWDLSEQSCLQILPPLTTNLGERDQVCTYYNPSNRMMYVAGRELISFQIYPLLNPEYTDGITHSKEVSIIIYVKLFRVLITCGYDSFIIVWDPYAGRRIKFIRHAHTITVHGETMPVEITAATLDPSQQFLITGASNGTLKVWNYNTASCVRNMSIQEDCEIFSIVWIKYRILVMGENRGVDEFSDSDEIGSNIYKTWSLKHSEDVLCSAVLRPTTLVTAGEGGDIVLWRLETGQPYGMYNVHNPKERIQLVHQPLHKAKEKDSRVASSKSSILDRKAKLHSQSSLYSGSQMARLPNLLSSTKRLHRQPKSTLNLTHKRTAINVMRFLTTRPCHPRIGSLMIALEDGMVQMWSHHAGGGYISDFKATHSVKDYVISMCTDKKNSYLFTGHMTGYIKTWLMYNYGMPDEFKTHLCMPKVRLTFPFLWADVIQGRAKRAHKSNEPMLLNSYKAHLKPVTCLDYIDRTELLFSSSSDGSARVWSLNGRYLGTLGTFKQWTDISSTVPPSREKDRVFHVPTDIKRSGSFTTMRVLTGGFRLKERTKKQEKQHWESIIIDGLDAYGEKVEFDTMLGSSFQMPGRTGPHYCTALDDTLNYIPIYSEMDLPRPIRVERPSTPELMKKIRATPIQKKPLF